MSDLTTTEQMTKEASPLAGLTKILRDNIRQYGMLVALIAIMAFFQIQTDGTLMKPVNLTNLILPYHQITLTTI